MKHTLIALALLMSFQAHADSPRSNEYEYNQEVADDAARDAQRAAQRDSETTQRANDQEATAAMYRAGWNAVGQ